MGLFKNLSIGAKLLIVLLLISILPLFVVTSGFYRLGKSKLTKQTIHILDVQAKNTSARINSYINIKFNHIHRFTDVQQLIHILRMSKEKQPRIIVPAVSSFRAKLRIDPDFLSLFLLDTEGNVVLSTTEKFNGNYAVRPFFSEAMKGRNYVSPPCVDGGVSCVYFSIPVVHGDKKLGVMALQCAAGELWELIEHENDRVGLGNAVILSNSDGVRIAHSTKRDLVFKAWVTLKPEIKEQILKEERYGSDIKEIAFTDIPEVMEAVTSVTPPPYFQHRLVIGKETYHSAIKVMDNGWRIMCTIPESTFLEPVHTNIFYMSIVVGVITCLVIEASVVIGKLGTKRINVFTSMSKEIARGNFTKEVPFTDGDEIGQLGRAFNTMSASIRQKIEQLSAINNVVLGIHAHIDLELLLQDVVNVARRLINAEMSVLILLDEQGKKIKYFKTSMPKPCAMKDQPEGKGLLGVVVKKGLAIRLANMKEDLRSVGLPADHPPIHTLLGIPIKINDKPIGGVFLANKADNGRFTLEDEELLLILVYQAAVAIENARLLEAAHRLAITDGLTGLLNHREFYRRLADYLKGSERYHYAVSLLMIDIDHFKQFNDTYGHQMGDQVLKTVGDTIKTQVRDVDVCARYGGEEFVVILANTDTSQAVMLAERMRSVIFAYPFKHDGIRSQLSVSIGIASFPKDADNIKDLVKRADEALYMAKESGRNKVCCYKATQ
jgi:diguanylate cyclase (GGDEF)-like protein